MANMLFSIKHMDGRTRAIFLDIAAAMWFYRRRKLVVTDVWRTVEQQTDIYKGTFKISGHVDNPCRSIDFRSTSLTNGDKKFLDGYYKRTHKMLFGDAILEHDVGRSIHYHLQTPRRAGAIYEPYYFTDANISINLEDGMT